MFTLEEGTPLIQSSVETEVKRSTSLKLISVLSIVALLVTVAFVGYQGKFSVPSVTDFSSDSERLTAKQKDYNLFAHKHADNTKGEFMNKYMSHLVLEDDHFHPYKYLQGNFLTSKYRTVGHGLDSEGNIVKGQKSFYSVDINLFGAVSKTHYSTDRTVESKQLIGKFKGLDIEGNAIFTDGAYCESERGPSYGKLEVLCGPDFKVQEVYQQSACNMVIKISHPMQCQHPVTTVEATDLLAGVAVPGTPYKLAAAGSPFAPIPMGAVSPFAASSSSPGTAVPAVVASPAVGPNLGPNLIE